MVVQHGYIVGGLSEGVGGSPERECRIRLVAVGGESFLEHAGDCPAVLNDEHAQRVLYLLFVQDRPHLFAEALAIHRGREKGVGPEVGSNAVGLFAYEGGRDHQDGYIVQRVVFGRSQQTAEAPAVNPRHVEVCDDERGQSAVLGGHIRKCRFNPGEDAGVKSSFE